MIRTCQPWFVLLLTATLTLAQWYPVLAREEADSLTTGRWEFLPAGTLIPPLLAHPQESRVGVRKEIGTSRLKLDIGSSLDFFQLAVGEHSRLRVGGDFFTYALTTSAEGLRLQVDAVDGFFGGHIVLCHIDRTMEWDLRLRLMHLSAHLIDGHFDTGTMMWKGGQLPIPFTRDFGELTAIVRFPLCGGMLSCYSGFDYATLVRPSDFRRLATLHGFEWRSTALCATIFGKPFTVYIADNLSLVGVPTYIGNNVVEAGIKLGNWTGSGIRFYINYSSGMEFFSQYYNLRRDKGGIGFAFDVW